MPRPPNDDDFRQAFDELIVRGRFNEEPSYYPRYRSRYHWIAKTFAMLAPAPPCSVLDVGGGQMAVLTKSLWGDNCTATDIGDEYLDYVLRQLSRNRPSAVWQSSEAHLATCRLS